MKYLFSILIASLALSTFAQTDQSCKISLKELNIDSLKWKMYVLTFDAKLKQVIENELGQPTISDSIVSPIQCNLKFISIEKKGDSIECLIDFYKIKESERYVHRKADYYIGVGHINKLQTYYPLSGKTAMDVSPSFYSQFFKNQEQLFINFIKTYKGEINSWLRKMLTEKGIL
jgi:hypothetical protein